MTTAAPSANLAPPTPEAPGSARRLLLAAVWLLPLVAALPGLLILVAAGLLLAHRLKTGGGHGLGTGVVRRIGSSGLPVLFAGLLASTAISVALSINRALSWPNLLLAGAYLLTIWVVSACFAGKAALEKALQALFWGMVPWAALGIVFSLGKLRWDADWGPVQVHLGTWDHRANSILLHPNILSGYLIFAIAAGLAAARGRWALHGPGLVVLAVCQILTQSRSGWVGTLAMLLVFLALTVARGAFSGGTSRRAWLTAGLGVAAVAVAAPFAWARLATLFDPGNASNLGRLHVWESAREMILARPLFGWGPGTWSLAYPAFRDPAEFENLPHAHNILLHLGAEYGLLMVLCLLALTGIFAWHALRETWADPANCCITFPLVAGLAGYLVMGLFEFTLSEGRNAIAFFIFLGVLGILGTPALKTSPERR
jgi:O-antigen ligase